MLQWFRSFKTVTAVEPFHVCMYQFHHHKNSENTNKNNGSAIGGKQMAIRKTIPLAQSANKSKQAIRKTIPLAQKQQG